MSTLLLRIFIKPPKGTVPFGGFAFETKCIKYSVYAALKPIKPTIGTVPLGGVKHALAYITLRF